MKSREKMLLLRRAHRNLEKQMHFMVFSNDRNKVGERLSAVNVMLEEAEGDALFRQKAQESVLTKIAALRAKVRDTQSKASPVDAAILADEARTKGLRSLATQIPQSNTPSVEKKLLQASIKQQMSQLRTKVTTLRRKHKATQMHTALANNLVYRYAPEMAAKLAKMKHDVEKFVCTKAGFQHMIASMNHGLADLNKDLNEIFVGSMSHLARKTSALTKVHNADSQLIQARQGALAIASQIEGVQQQLSTANSSQQVGLVKSLALLQQQQSDSQKKVGLAQTSLQDTRQRLRSVDVWHSVNTQCQHFKEWETAHAHCCTSVVNNWRWTQGNYATWMNAKTAAATAGKVTSAKDLAELKNLEARTKKAWEDSAEAQAIKEVLDKCTAKKEAPRNVAEETRVAAMVSSAKKHAEKANAHAAQAKADYKSAQALVASSKESLSKATAPAVVEQWKGVVASAVKKESVMQAALTKATANSELADTQLVDKQRLLYAARMATDRIREMKSLMVDLKQALITTSDAKKKRLVMTHLTGLKEKIAAMKEARSATVGGVGGKSTVARRDRILATLHSKLMVRTLTKRLDRLKSLAREGEMTAEHKKLTAEIAKLTARIKSIKQTQTGLEAARAETAVDKAPKAVTLGQQRSSGLATPVHQVLGEGVPSTKESKTNAAATKAAGVRAELTQTLLALRKHQDAAQSFEERDRVKTQIAKVEQQLDAVIDKQSTIQSQASVLADAAKQDMAMTKAKELTNQLQTLSLSLQRAAVGMANRGNFSAVERAMGNRRASDARRHAKRLQSMLATVTQVRAQMPESVNLRVAAAAASRQAALEKAVLKSKGKTATMKAQLQHLNGIENTAHRAIEMSKSALQSKAVRAKQGDSPCDQLSESHATTCKALEHEMHVGCTQLHGDGFNACCDSIVVGWKWGRAVYKDYQASQSPQSTEADSAEAIRERKLAKTAWEQSPEKRIATAASASCRTQQAAQPSTQDFINSVQLQARNDVDNPLSIAQEKPQVPSAGEPADVRVSDIIRKSTSELNSDLEKVHARYLRADAMKTALKELARIDAMIKSVQRQSQSAFREANDVNSSPPSADLDAESNDAKAQLDARKKEWAKKEAARKAEETAKAAANSERVTIELAKKLFMLKQKPAPPALPPDVVPPENYVSRAQQEATMAASLHAAFAAFLMGTQTRAIDLDAKSKAASRTATRAEAALVKVEANIKRAATYAVSPITEVQKQGASQLEQLRMLAKKVSEQKEKAFAENKALKQANLKMDSRLRKVKSMVKLASGSGPAFDEKTQAKADRDKKLNAVLNGLSNAASGGMGNDAKAKFAKETDRLEKTEKSNLEDKKP